MPSCWRGCRLHYWAGRGYPVGMLISPEGCRPVADYIPFACDNGRFTDCDERPWNEENFLRMLEKYAFADNRPRWIAVPDVLGSRDETLEEWGKWSHRLARDFPFPLAFVVQDGMEPSDVPTEAEVVFIGGSSSWKWRTAKDWAENFPRVHVGRVNSLDKVLFCRELGVESVDGTSWFREPRQLDKLEKCFRVLVGEEKLPDQMEIPLR